MENTPHGHRELVRWVEAASVRRIGVEGSGNHGRQVALALREVGVDVVEVPPQLTARERRRQSSRVKDDATDALLIARVTLRESAL